MQQTQTLAINMTPTLVYYRTKISAVCKNVTASYSNSSGLVLDVGTTMQEGINTL
jgi:hypothetical protein